MSWEKDKEFDVRRLKLMWRAQEIFKTKPIGKIKVYEVEMILRETLQPHDSFWDEWNLLKAKHGFGLTLLVESRLVN